MVPDEGLARLAEVRGTRVLTRLPTAPHDELKGSQAGVYELTCGSWDELVIVAAPHPTTAGAVLETEHFVRHVQGDLVQLSDAEARRLLAAEAVRVPGEREQQVAEALQRKIERAQAELEELRARRERFEATASRGAPVDELWQAGVAPGEAS